MGVLLALLFDAHLEKSGKPSPRQHIMGSERIPVTTLESMSDEDLFQKLLPVRLSECEGLPRKPFPLSMPERNGLPEGHRRRDDRKHGQYHRTTPRGGTRSAPPRSMYGHPEMDERRSTMLNDLFRMEHHVFEELNDALADPSNPLVADFLRVVAKYGTPEEINAKADEAEKNSQHP